LIHRGLVSLSLRLANVIEKLTSVLISIVDSNATAIDSNIKTNTEVLRQEWLLRSVWLEDHLSLEESTLRGTRINLLRLGDHDRLVFKEIENGNLAKAVVFQTAFDNAFFEITLESQNLFVKLDESWLELLLDVFTTMCGED